MSAELSACGNYRYSLGRFWSEGQGTCLFIMLNPSTADATEDDPTIRRCISFAKSWGYSKLEVVNLFAFRATNPDEMRNATQSIGPRNDETLLRFCARADKIVCAWGTKGSLWGRSIQVKELLAKFDLYGLGLTTTLEPKHPLYLRRNLAPQLWRSGST